MRVLAWAGAPLPLFRPSRGDVRTMREQLTQQTKIQCALDSTSDRCTATTRRRSSIDDRVAFVGGIDLTSNPATASTEPPSGPR